MSLQNFSLQKLNPFSLFMNKGFKRKQDAGTTVPVRHKDYPQQASQGSAVAPIQQMFEDMDRLLNGFSFPFPVGRHRRGLSSLFENWPGTLNPSFNPSLNLVAERDAYVVTLEVAGLDEQDLDLEVRNGQLVITGSKQDESDDRDRLYYRIERHYGTFQRVLSLPEDALAANIQAVLRKGLLTVRIPRQTGQINNRRRITIEQH